MTHKNKKHFSFFSVPALCWAGVIALLFSFYGASSFAVTINDAYKDYLNEDYQAAAENARSLPVKPETIYLTGLSYLKMANYEKAREYFQKVAIMTKQSPVYEKSKVKFADTFFLEGDLNQAKNEFCAILKNKRMTDYASHAHLRLAQVASKQGDWTEKQKHLAAIEDKYAGSVESRFVPILKGYGDYFTIQVGAFTAKRNVLALKNELQRKGYKVYVLKSESGYTIYKVRVGKYLRRAEAERVTESLVKDGYAARIYP